MKSLKNIPPIFKEIEVHLFEHNFILVFKTQFTPHIKSELRNNSFSFEKAFITLG